MEKHIDLLRKRAIFILSCVGWEVHEIGRTLYLTDYEVTNERSLFKDQYKFKVYYTDKVRELLTKMEEDVEEKAVMHSPDI